MALTDVHGEIHSNTQERAHALQRIQDSNTTGNGTVKEKANGECRCPILFSHYRHKVVRCTHMG